MNYYLTYGLILASSVPLPLPECAPVEKPDVKITFSDLPPVCLRPEKADRINLATPEGAFLCVARGTDIVILCRESCSPEALTDYLLGNAMAAILYQRGRILLHAGTLVRDDRTVTLCGASGTGKSTVSYALQQRGWQQVSDDISVLCPVQSGPPRVLPSCPVQKLTSEAVERFQLAPEEYTLAWRQGQMTKLRVKVRHFCREPVPLQQVYLLRKATELPMGICHAEQVSPPKEITELLPMMYDERLLRAPQRESVLASCLKCLSGVKFTQITRSAEGDTLSRILRIIETDEG